MVELERKAYHPMRKSQYAAEQVAFTIRQAEPEGSETDSIIKRSFPAGKTTALPMEYVRRYNHGRLAVKYQIDCISSQIQAQYEFGG